MGNPDNPRQKQNDRLEQERYRALLDHGFESFQTYNRSLNWLASGGLIALYFVTKHVADSDISLGGVSVALAMISGVFLALSLLCSVASMLTAGESYLKELSRIDDETPQSTSVHERLTNALNYTALGSMILGIGCITLYLLGVIHASV